MTATVPDPFALAAAAFTPREPTLADAEFPTPGSLALALDAKETRNPAHLRVLDDHLVQLAAGDLDRLLVTMPPQEGKSTRAVRYFVLWLLKHNPDLRIAIVSFESEAAVRWGRHVRDDIEANHLGIRVREDVKAAGRWQIVGHRGSVYCTGWQGSLTGQPVDMLIIDDPVKGTKEVDSPTYRQDQWDWWIATARARLGPNSRVLCIMTRWHPDDLGGRFLTNEPDRWTVLTIPAQAEPGDPIGREPGEWLPSARGRTPAQWEQLQTETPDRWWSAQYQGRPTPPEGAVWQEAWIDDNRCRTGDMPSLVRRLVMVDTAGSSAAGAAETGIVVIGEGADGDAYVLADYSLRADARDRWRRVAEAAADFDAHEVVIEEDFGGDNLQALAEDAWREFVRTDLRGRRVYQVPRYRSIRAKGRGSKRMRAEAAAGYYKGGRVHHVSDGSDRLAGLEKQQLEWTGEGESPDRVDALSHGVREIFDPVGVYSGRRIVTAGGRWAGVSGRR
jgi:hypothetical protein